MSHDAAAATLQPGTSSRLLSLDAFRGLVIAAMFLVNVGGADPAFPAWFPHRGWAGGAMGNGLADFVFPCFLFIVGVAVPFSMASGRGKGLAFWQRALSALRRGITLYLLGTLIWCASIGYQKEHPIDLSVLTHWDILPLIGFSYVVCVLLTHLPIWSQALFVLAVLIFKWLILARLVHPTFGEVVWTEHDSYQNYLRANLGWWGVALTQGSATAAITQLGALCGITLRRVAPRRAAALLLTVGITAIALGWAWHRFGDMPMSKDFLTSSYILMMAGTGAVGLALLFWIVDCVHLTTLAPLRILGMNAIAVYVLAEFMWKTVMMQWQVRAADGSPSIAIASIKAWLQFWTTPVLGSWLLVAGYLLLYWLIALVLYRKKWFVKV